MSIRWFSVWVGARKSQVNTLAPTVSAALWLAPASLAELGRLLADKFPGLSKHGSNKVNGKWRMTSNEQRMVLQSRSSNHGGLTTPLLFARVCLPVELRLLRCTNARSSRVAGVSPPWDEKRTCKDDYAQVHTGSSHAEQERRA